MLPNLALIGKAGSGKDTAYELLREQFGYRRLAFADKLKDVAELLWGEKARTDRDKLQRLGEYVRKIDPDTWVNAALRDVPLGHNQGIGFIGEQGQYPEPWRPWCVTDCRYRNEAWRLKGEDFVIVRILADRNERINRLRANGKLGPSGWEDHISETDLDEWAADYEVRNTGTKIDLLAQLADVIKHAAMAA